MPTLESSRSRTARLRGRAFVVALLALVAAVAGWLGTRGAMAEQDGVPRHASAALEQAAWYMMSLPRKAGAVALAAQGTQEGHWRFVNRAGEMFTVGTPDEMKRVISVLYPEAKAGARVSLYLTEDTVYRHRATLGSLPARAELNMVVGQGSYRLLRRSGTSGERLLAQVRANLSVEIGEQGLFEEALWHLSRPLGSARVRVLALRPGGPRALSASPAVDPAGKHPLADAIDPASLAAAMGNVSGQVLLVVGRVERGLLYVRPSRGPEHILALKDLFKAAADADVSLIVLRAASTPRQPAGRNRLWDPEGALKQAQLADLLSGIAGRNRGVAVAATATGRRTVLDVTIGGDLPGRSAGDRLSAVVAEIAGGATVTGMQANLLRAEYQGELDWRFLPRIPAVVQIGYLVLVVLGLLGVPVARTWWARIWPPEAVAEYAGRGGYWAACAVRGLVFLAVFVPVTAVAAGPYNLVSQIGETVRAPGRGWRWFRGRGADRAGDALDPRGRQPPPLDETMHSLTPVPESTRKSRRKART